MCRFVISVQLKTTNIELIRFIKLSCSYFLVTDGCC